MRIAFIGKRHAGKSTAKNAAKEILREDYQIIEEVAFADALKNAYVEAFRKFEFEIGIDPMFTRAELDANKDLHRTQLEDFGTKFGRQRFGDDLWIRLTEKRLMDINDRYEGYESIVVDDCRFLNEAALLKKQGFTLVRLLRSDFSRGVSIVRSRGNLNPTGVDVQAVLNEYMPSEVEVDAIKCDYAVTNTGKYDELYEEIQFVIKAASEYQWTEQR